MTTTCGHLHSPKISCVQSVYNLTFYNRKWTFTTLKNHVDHKRHGLWAMLLFIYNLTIIAKTKCTTFQNEMYIFLIFSHLAKTIFERLLITV